MHISRLELENIKSHVSSTYDFAKGTTAITGENGAGKTTIIEAIAWVLFDFLDYKKEEFLRRGAKKGTARVTFESGLDEREYIVYRDTGSGYYVTDPRLQVRIAEKKEEVFRFLWQHLGLEPGTDLRSLFRQAIGVPQGTFTAIFLDGGQERKTAFDRLLKVEEYRQAAEKLRETSRHIDLQVTAAREGIARAEGELVRSENIETEHRGLVGQMTRLSEEVQASAEDLNTLRADVDALDAQERRIFELRSALEKASAENQRSHLVYDQLERSVESSAAAAHKVAAARPFAEKHIETLGQLRELERERGERDKLRAELAAIDAAIVNVRADGKRLAESLAAAENAHREIADLRPMAELQGQIEAELRHLHDSVAAARAARSQIASLDEKLKRMRDGYREVNERLKEIEAKAADAARLSELEMRDGQLLREIAALRASLERDERFQQEIKSGLCPILSQKCLNLEPGQTLESFVSSQFNELRSQIALLENEQASVASLMRSAREAAGQLSTIDTLQRRLAELKDEGSRLNNEKDHILGVSETLEAAEKKLADAESRLAALSDPRARTKFLEVEAGREKELRERFTKIESNLERLENDRNIAIEKLESYIDLDANWTAVTAERDATADAHRTFVANEAEAEALGERQLKLDEALEGLRMSGAQKLEAETRLSEAADGFDGELLLKRRAELLQAERGYAQVAATLAAAEQQERGLAAELKRFTEIRRSLAVEFKEKDRLERIAEATAFIRDTLKEAAPRVARNYVYHVSLEANLLFREITGNAERTLKWGDDYAIMLEEDGFDRPFQSLSGGEQMAAALAVRLALLKQLTDIRIAFFDEPTTNMDAERRENLATQISRITNFDQLFVISHDETFDSYVDNVISVG
ncbi:MAG: SMC family ATPase [Pyrinomonadaceae bacterium]|nr:SMC family ATPase [Pyrinomonadaceae bacterium]